MKINQNRAFLFRLYVRMLEESFMRQENVTGLEQEYWYLKRKATGGKSTKYGIELFPDPVNLKILMTNMLNKLRMMWWKAIISDVNINAVET